MAPQRDFTKAEFEKRLKAHGIRATNGLFGYYAVTPNTHVSALPAQPETRRGVLAYLLQQQARVLAADEIRAKQQALEAPGKRWFYGQAALAALDANGSEKASFASVKYYALEMNEVRGRASGWAK